MEKKVFSILTVIGKTNDKEAKAVSGTVIAAWKKRSSTPCSRRMVSCFRNFKMIRDCVRSDLCNRRCAPRRRRRSIAYRLLDNRWHD